MEKLNRKTTAQFRVREGSPMEGVGVESIMIIMCVSLYNKVNVKLCSQPNLYYEQLHDYMT